MVILVREIDPDRLNGRFRKRFERNPRHLFDAE